MYSHSLQRKGKCSKKGEVAFLALYIMDCLSRPPDAELRKYDAGFISYISLIPHWWGYYNAMISASCNFCDAKWLLWGEYLFFFGTSFNVSERQALEKKHDAIFFVFHRGKCGGPRQKPAFVARPPIRYGRSNKSAQDSRGDNNM